MIRTAQILLYPAVALATIIPTADARQQTAREVEFQTDVVTQAQIASGQISLKQIRTRGLAVFSTPFTQKIGYGDGPVNIADKVSPGGRPTLQDNGVFLRANGLDGQTCIECHAVGSNAVVPFRFGVGGVGGSVTNVMFQPRSIDVDDDANLSYAFFDGRFINPPFLFGSGGITLLAKEMTQDLQELRKQAAQNPGQTVQLITKGVSFGSIVFQGGVMNTDNMEGIDADLVVKPFGRKGEFATTRGFDIDAMRFHFGMEPTEVVGPGVDGDGDGVVDEISPGDLSSLVIFNTHLERPVMAAPTPQAVQGGQLFMDVGCADCHVPSLETRRPYLTYSFPEVDEDPGANVFFAADLRQSPPGFDPAPGGGVVVPLFSDLKRHEMGPGLAESFGSELDDQFITARLWGVADTAPYLHDGRAHTLQQAILLHGGEAKPARDAFAALPGPDKKAVIAFLRTLRTPEEPAKDILPDE